MIFYYNTNKMCVIPFQVDFRLIKGGYIWLVSILYNKKGETEEEIKIISSLKIYMRLAL